jgi:protein ImuB
MFACIYCQKLPDGVSLTEFAYGFSPIVEETDATTVVIDAVGCELIFGSAYELATRISARAAGPANSGGLGSKVNVALAANPDAAINAAKFFEGISFIAPGEELTGLGELPVENLRSVISVSSLHENTKVEKAPGFLSIDPKQLEEIFETLQLWGVRTFRDFATLPRNGVSERLGQPGVRLQQLASGRTERHLVVNQPPPVFSNSLEVEYPVRELEPLSFIFARLLNQLCAALDAHALATNELRVQMKLEDQQTHERLLNLPYPMRDSKVFFKLLLLDTEMHPPASAVVAVTIAGEPVKPRVLQNGLFIPLAPEPEKLELTLARLGKLLGATNVGSPELIDTHRPDAFRMKRFVLKTEQRRRSKRAQPPAMVHRGPRLAFRMFRPPLRALVEATQGVPTQISAWSKKLSVHGKVVRAAGPWRTTGDWWLLDSWARDEWDVAVESGSTRGASAPGLYRIYRELRNGTWFVEGNYD